MSNYADDRFDQQRDAAVQAQAEFEGRARRVCSFHAVNFPNESNLIEDGGNGKVSHGCCSACEPLEMAKAEGLLAIQRTEGLWPY